MLMSKPRTTPSEVYKFINCYLGENVSFTTKMTLQTGASLKPWLLSSYENLKQNKTCCHPSHKQSKNKRNWFQNIYLFEQKVVSMYLLFVPKPKKKSCFVHFVRLYNFRLLPFPERSSPSFLFRPGIGSCLIILIVNIMGKSSK